MVSVFLSFYMCAGTGGMKPQMSSVRYKEMTFLCVFVKSNNELRMRLWKSFPREDFPVLGLSDVPD